MKVRAVQAAPSSTTSSRIHYCRSYCQKRLLENSSLHRKQKEPSPKPELRKSRCKVFSPSRRSSDTQQEDRTFRAERARRLVPERLRMQAFKNLSRHSLRVCRPAELALGARGSNRPTRAHREWFAPHLPCCCRHAGISAGRRSRLRRLRIWYIDRLPGHSSACDPARR
jgi:hypothetical protein